MSASLSLAPERYFTGEAAQRQLAQELYDQVATKPLVCPHGHVDPRMFADPDYEFGSRSEEHTSELQSQ